MDNILSRLIYEQKKELLEKIADDKFNTVEEKENFVNKYHKKNYAYVHTMKKDNLENYKKKFERVMR